MDDVITEGRHRTDVMYYEVHKLTGSKNTEPWLHRKRNEIDKSHQTKCSQCLVSSESVPEVEFHMIWEHSDLQRLKCPQDPLTFLRSEVWESHRNVHGGGPLKCWSCGETFPRSFLYSSPRGEAPGCWLGVLWSDYSK